VVDGLEITIPLLTKSPGTSSAAKITQRNP
jgi:hypothetical protein